ncbi:dihydrofolate reductase family protein [Caulobacter sp.]|uniref:dihydrofolate reductase family protein n=1 Tax=Caulobacter sp. TaxID=78 RepID=UPI001614F99F
MRELILKMAMSVDGFVSDLSGTNTWMFGADDEARAWNVETLWNASLHIMGSRSFEAMAAWWPSSTDIFAPPMNEIPKAVFTRQGAAILDGARDSWAQAHVAGGDLAEEIARLKAQDGKPILAHGGVTFARSLVAYGLVDRFVLVVAPVALGDGLSLFPPVETPRRLQLVGSKAFPGGAVAQTYRPG